MDSVRVRFAPSPTGYLHVGGARTALYNFLYARKMKGTFVLRVEDTDLDRSTEESMRMQIQDLNWLGLNWDEGPDPVTLVDKGPYGPYRQSLRKDIYRKHAEDLLERGLAYYDFRTDEELGAAREEAEQTGKPRQVERPAKIVSLKEARERVANGEPAAIRFKILEKRDYQFNDLVRGDVSFPSDMVGDFVILRSNGMPVYNFCCVIDDALMKITHVLRGEEHLSNTLRQLMLYEAFGYPIPKIGHLSVILGTDRQKLSKRHGATSCNDFMKRGFLPDALNNFIALMGWSSPKGQEILSRQELIEQFGTDRLNPAAAVFDDQKLNWVNATHLRALEPKVLWHEIKPFLDEAGLELSSDSHWQEQAVEVFKTSMTTLADAVQLFKPLSDRQFSLSSEGLEVLKWPETKKVLTEWRNGIQNLSDASLSEKQFEALQEDIKNRCGVKGKNLFQPIRVAVIGQPQGTELKTLVPLMPKESLIKRVDTCLAQIPS